MVQVEPKAGMAAVTYKLDVTSETSIRRKIEDAGYSIKPGDFLQLQAPGGVADSAHSTSVFQAENEIPCDVFKKQLETKLCHLVSGAVAIFVVPGINGPPLGIVSFNPRNISTEIIDQEVGMTRLRLSTTLLSVKGMTCQSCVRNIESHVGQEPGVKGVKVSLKEENARFVYDGELLTAEALAEKIEDMGFECSVLNSVALDAGGPEGAIREALQPKPGMSHPVVYACFW